MVNHLVIAVAEVVARRKRNGKGEKYRFSFLSYHLFVYLCGKKRREIYMPWVSASCTISIGIAVKRSFGSS